MPLLLTILSISINRNILECKDSYFSTYKSDLESINRNILECKEALKRISSLAISVLIETYWNVKKAGDE